MYWAVCTENPGVCSKESRVRNSAVLDADAVFQGATWAQRIPVVFRIAAVHGRPGAGVYQQRNIEAGENFVR